ncbi:MAG: ABC transporter substrate-binding protein [Planctomycetota bacterium]|jgi:peptide/nickel transport system substrate-binding protein
MMKMKKTAGSLLAAAVLLGLAGCVSNTAGKGASPASGGGSAPAGASSATAAASKTPRNTLVILGSENWQATFSPLKHTSTMMLHAEALALDRLMKMNERTQQAEPALATEWSYDDTHTVLTVKLRQGVKFHDGSDFTAEDAAASCEAYSSAKNVSGSWWADELSCKVIDSSTFTITPKSGKPLGSLVNMLCSTPIMSADDLKDPANTIDKRYNGTGPFKLVKFENDTAYYDVNENHWDILPKIKHIKYKYVADSKTRLSALQSGEADIIERADSDTVSVLKNDPNTRVVTFLTTECKHLIPKFKMEPMNNALVRKAIAFAIDYDGIVKNIMSGYAQKADSFISSTIWGYSPVKGVGEYDPAKAAELLKQAGYPGGKGLPELNLYTSVGFYPKTKEYNEHISACVAAVGVKCTVVPMDTSAWGDILYDETPCYLIDCGWQPSGIEPELKLNSWYAQGRISHYEPTPELKNIMARFKEETDDTRRKEVLKYEYLPALADQMPDIPVLRSMAIYGVRSNVKGLDFTSGADFILNKVTKE